jgi:hypothetical protein
MLDKRDSVTPVEYRKEGKPDHAAKAAGDFKDDDIPV